MLDLNPRSLGVLRSAIYEWPRRPELGRRYLDAMARMTNGLEAVITADRDSGLALPGPPAPQLATVLMWTLERSIAGSLAEESGLSDTTAVATYLGKLLASVIYGR
ncbi:hypothetical protein ACFXG4_18020 [Nocardia sp. NPDC059246]|uniref:hypothetical protein n=1 Tax=unclassified Nocardia TaxID=2637762 RepID=UPI003697068B